jgi:hypothetical protein
MTREVQVHVSFKVADDVTDEQLLGFLPSIAAQVDEPVSNYDGSGNEVRFDSEHVMLDLYVDGKNLACDQRFV